MHAHKPKHACTHARIHTHTHTLTHIYTCFHTQERVYAAVTHTCTLAHNPSGRAARAFQIGCQTKLTQAAQNPLPRSVNPTTAYCQTILLCSRLLVRSDDATKCHADPLVSSKLLNIFDDVVAAHPAIRSSRRQRVTHHVQRIYQFKQ